MLTRKNILDLLGNDSRKYHSCVISSYSFDFLFFEQRILPKLRAAGISNINIFVDSGMLEKALANFKGGEYLQKKSNYSLTPVTMRGAFHPKIFLAVGKNRGFLSVGSGNLTGPGLSYNDEIWGSFFFNEKEVKTKTVFQQAKYFVEQLKEHAHDENITKINWLNEAGWYKSLKKTSESQSLKLADSTVILKTTMGTSSLFKDILVDLPLNPKQIKIVSPYYNKDGAFIKNLKDHFQPEKIHCIINSQNGNSPVAFNDSTVQFSDWKSLMETKQKIGNLHAKAFQFEYPDKTIFILGSANASTEAFGNNEKNGVNAEGILLIESAKKRDYFKDLGIVFPKVGNIDIKLVAQTKQEESQYQKLPIKIDQAKISPEEIKLIFREIQTGSYVLKFENADEEIVASRDISLIENILIIKDLKIESHVFKCAVWDSDMRVSNYAFVLYPTELLKTNPDERLAKFNAIRDRDFFDDLEMELFLDFLNEEDIFYKESTTSRTGIPVTPKEKVAPEAKIVSTEEFNKNEASYDDSLYHTGPHLSTLIEDFLDALNFSTDTKTDEISDNIEEAEIGSEEKGQSAEDKIEHRNIELSFQQGLRIRNKLEKIFNDISGFIDKSCLEKKLEYDIRTLNAMLIALNLMFKYHDKRFERKQCEITLKYKDLNILKNLEYTFSLERKAQQTDNKNREVTYLIDINLLDEIKNEIEKSSDFSIIKMDVENVMISEYYYIPSSISTDQILTNSQEFIYVTLPIFLNLINRFKNNKLVIDKEGKERIYKIAVLSFLTINHFTWIKEQKNTKSLLLLNLFRDLKLIDESDKFAEGIEKRLQSMDKDSLKPYRDSLDLFKAYIEFSKKLKENSLLIKQNLSPLLKDKIIFSDKYGFGILDFVYTNKYINIISPLGYYNKETFVYGFSEVFIGNNIKVFK